MKKLLTLLIVLCVSCSSDDTTETRNLDALIGSWKMTNGTFIGSGISGQTDPFFNNTTLNIDKIDDSYLILFDFPNGSSGNSWVILVDDENRSRPINDTGIKRSNSITTYYDGEEMLIDSLDNEILIDIESNEVFDIQFNANTMTWTRTSNGYDIVYNFVED